MAGRANDLNSLAKAIPYTEPITTLLDKRTVGSTGALTNQDAAVFDITSQDEYHEGLMAVEVRTRNGRGATPTSPGSGKVVTVKFAFCSEPLSLRKLASGTIRSGGAGHVTNDLVTLVPENPTHRYNQPAIVQVTASSGVVTAVTVTQPGEFIDTPLALRQSATSGAGTGLIVTPTFTALLADTSGPVVLQTVAESIECTLPDSNSDGAAGIRFFRSPKFIHEGRYIAVWWDADALATNAKIDLTVKLIRL